MSQQRRITIIGGGLAGPLLACLLADDGNEVHILERRGDPRAAGYQGGRSINLALSARGLQALDQVGLKREVLATVVPMRGRMMHDTNGRMAFSPYSVIEGQAINSVSRGGLNCMLLDAACSRSNVRVSFEVQITDINVETGSVTWTDADGVSAITEADLLVGADGAGSAVRAAMHAATPVDAGTEFVQSSYKELTIPAGPGGAWQLPEHALHIWPRGHYMMIGLPNADGSFTCTCFWPTKGRDSFEEVATPEAIVAFFKKNFADAVPLMPDLVEDYLANPVGPLGTVRCEQYHHGSTTVLIGDAAHAIVPFFGQGMNAAFQDCLRLAATLRDCADQGEALAAYNHTQQPDGAAIAEFSLENFIEMRDKTGSRIFRLRQRIGKQLNRLFPTWYVPRYNLVSFTTIPYAQVKRRTQRQQWWVLGMSLAFIAGVILMILWILGTI
ncbi:MAG: FAD-dependent monooxygenase [Phycisphaerales bacterium]|nr:FAD-dependent monooxygenase [Phycisphaerales bacterium]